MKAQAKQATSRPHQILTQNLLQATADVRAISDIIMFTV